MKYYSIVYFIILNVGLSVSVPSSGLKLLNFVFELLINFFYISIGNCYLSTKVNSYFAPFVFYENGTLFDIITNENRIVLNPGQSVMLSCAPNFFKQLVPPQFPKNIQSVKATCIGGMKLEINHETLDYIQDLSCDLRVLEEVMVNVPDCSSHYRGVDFGYYNPIDGYSYVIGESCYSTEKKKTIFVHVKLRNSSDSSNNVVLRREHEHYFKGPHPSYSFRIQFLRTINARNVDLRIESLLGSKDAVSIGHKRFINENYLASKQFLSALSFTWNDLVVIENGKNFNNLDIIQKDVNSLGVFQLDLYTGGEGVVQLNGPDGNNVDIYLEQGSFPVSKFIWTVVKSDNKAVAFIYLNKPDATDEEIQSSAPCTDKCPKITWASNLIKNDQYKIIKDGYVWCCELKDIREQFTGIPDLEDVIGLFK